MRTTADVDDDVDDGSKSSIFRNYSFSMVTCLFPTENVNFESDYMYVELGVQVEVKVGEISEVGMSLLTELYMSVVDMSAVDRGLPMHLNSSSYPPMISFNPLWVYSVQFALDSFGFHFISFP